MRTLMMRTLMMGLTISVLASCGTQNSTPAAVKTSPIRQWTDSCYKFDVSNPDTTWSGFYFLGINHIEDRHSELRVTQGEYGTYVPLNCSSFGGGQYSCVGTDGDVTINVGGGSAQVRSSRDGYLATLECH